MTTGEERASSARNRIKEAKAKVDKDEKGGKISKSQAEEKRARIKNAEEKLKELEIEIGKGRKKLKEN